jgi:Ricin-type beta-trefoil lectin domain
MRHSIHALLSITFAIVVTSLFLHAPEVSAQSADVSGTLSFKNKQTSRCLHNNLQKVVFTWPCESTNTYQDWVGRYDSQGRLEYKNKKTGYCLAMSGSKVTSATCNDGITQRWFAFIKDSGASYALMNLSTFRCIYNASSSTINTSLTPCGNQNAYSWIPVR